MQVRIVKLPPDRWEEFKAIRLESLCTDPEAFGATYDATAQRPDEWWIRVLETAQVEPAKCVFFAEIDGSLVGLAGAYPEEDPAYVDVTSMFVKPEYRGRGYAYLLLKAVVDEVGGKGVRLCVNADQGEAVRLYERFGFVTLNETELTGHNGLPYRQLFMELRTNP